MTVADVSAGYQQAVGPLQKCLQQKTVIDPASAHHADQAHIAGVLDARYTGQIGPGVRAPVADESQDTRLSISSHKNTFNGNLMELSSIRQLFVIGH